MERYDFKVRRADGTVSVGRSTTASGMSAVWAIVADIAHGVEEIGSRILVTNDAGEVLILVGVATARAYPMANKEHSNPIAAAKLPSQFQTQAMMRDQTRSGSPAFALEIASSITQRLSVSA